MLKQSKTIIQRSSHLHIRNIIIDIRIPLLPLPQHHTFSSSAKTDTGTATTEKNDGKQLKKYTTKQQPNIHNDTPNNKNSIMDSMFTKQTQNQIQAISTQAQSLPNIITLSRIASTPILCHFVITEQYQLAIGGCFIAGFTDWLDGYIAKTYNQQTVFGTYLDPLADKILINSIAVSLSYVDILPLWSSVLWLGRDVVLVGTAYKMNAIAARGRGHNVADPSRTPLKVTPTFISKVNTVFQFGTIGIGLCLGCMDNIGCAIHVTGLDHSVDVMNSLSYMTGATTILSGLSYVDGKAMTKSGNVVKRKQ